MAREVPMSAPLLIVNPSSDREFRRLARDHLDTAGDEPARLETALRSRYPRAIVRPRDLSGETYTVWYVYREGHWIDDRKE